MPTPEEFPYHMWLPWQQMTGRLVQCKLKHQHVYTTVGVCPTLWGGKLYKQGEGNSIQTSGTKIDREGNCVCDWMD